VSLWRRPFDQPRWLGDLRHMCGRNDERWLTPPQDWGSRRGVVSEKGLGDDVGK